MPRPKKNPALGELGLDYQTPDEIEQILSTLPDENTKISLWRVTPQGGGAYVTEFDIHDFDFETIKNTYGGGKYKYIAKENGQIARQGKFEIDGPMKGTRQGTIKKYVEGVGVVYVTGEEQEMIKSKMNAQNGIGNPPSGDPMMLLLLQEIKALRESVAAKPATDNSEEAFINRMVMMKQLFAQPSPTQDFSKMAIDLIRQGMEVAASAENGGSPWMMVLDKVLPTIQDVLKVVSVQQTRAMPPMPVNEERPILNGHQKPAQPPIALTGFDAIIDELRAYLPTFLRAASMGTDPDVLIDLTIPQLPEDKINNVLQWLQSPEWFTDLQKLHPMIAGQAAWWNAFRNGMIEALTSPPTEENHQESD